MGKHETSFERVPKDLYPSPAWVIDALAEHVDLAGKTIWECAAGTGQMVEALKAAGATRVIATDIVRRKYPLDMVFDFTSGRNPKLPRWDLIVTNPAYGEGNRLAVRFIEAGLQRIANGGTLALLLPVDFDSGVTRRHLFHDCPQFLAKIVLTKRVKWFDHGDEKAPKENHCWCVWTCPVLRGRVPPQILYAPEVSS